MTDHVRLLGDEVEAAKWVGYARGRKNGSLTSPAPGVVVRSNKVGSMNLLTISAEEGGLLWLFGIPIIPKKNIPYVEATAAISGKISLRIPLKLTFYDKPAYPVSVQVWGGIKFGEYISSWPVAVGDSGCLYTDPNAGGGELYDFKHKILKTFVIASSTPSSTVIYETYMITEHKHNTYIMGKHYVNWPAAPMNVGLFKTTSNLPELLYDIPTQYPIYVNDPLPRTAFIAKGGPLFFAMYLWNINTTGGELRVMDYISGAILHTWVPTAAQSNILQNLFKPVDSNSISDMIAVSYKYIAIVTRVFSTTNTAPDAPYTSSYLFIWEVGDKKLKLLSQTSIKDVITTYSISFDMKSAYEGKI